MLEVRAKENDKAENGEREGQVPMVRWTLQFSVE